MQKAAFITGTSKGIGKATAKLLLENNYHVFGYSRTNSIKHQNFSFTKIDLSNLSEVKQLILPKFNNSQIIFINNAASLGHIVPLNLKKESDIISEYKLNIITPTILTAKFISTFKDNPKILLNISSGASKKSVAGWSTYCASKSALDRLTETITEEKHKNLKTFSIHPGVVDTDMQTKIRKSDPAFFPLLKKFTKYHIENQLENVEKTAQKVLYVIQNHSKFNENIIIFRDLNFS